MINKHEPYLERYIYSLVLEKKIKDAINVIKKNKDKKNSNFFDANLLLILDSLKKRGSSPKVSTKKILLSLTELFLFELIEYFICFFLNKDSIFSVL